MAALILYDLYFAKVKVTSRSLLYVTLDYLHKWVFEHYAEWWL